MRQHKRVLTRLIWHCQVPHRLPSQCNIAMIVRTSLRRLNLYVERGAMGDATLPSEVRAFGGIRRHTSCHGSWSQLPLRDYARCGVMHILGWQQWLPPCYQSSNHSRVAADLFHGSTGELRLRKRSKCLRCSVEAPIACAACDRFFTQLRRVSGMNVIEMYEMSESADASYFEACCDGWSLR